MKLSKITIKNVLGIDHLEFEAGKLVEITGDNGVGKSSVLAAIQGALGGGNLAKLIRNGADKADVVLLFDDGHKITTKVTEKKTDRKVETPQGWKQDGTKHWLESKINPFSFSPVRFLAADNKDRVAMLLEASKLELTFERLQEACAIDLRPLFGVKAGPLPDPLASLEVVRKRVYDYRTEVNRAAKDKASHAAELEATLPASIPDDTDPNELRMQLDAVRGQIADAKVAVTRQSTERTSKAALAAKDKVAAARAVYDQAVREAEAERAEATQAASAWEREALAKVAADYQPLIDDLNEQIGAAEASKETLIRAQQTRRAMDAARNAAREHEGEAAAMSESLKAIDELKVETMKKLPVPGLEVVDGELHFDGVRFDTLNEARRVVVAMKVAEAAAGQIPLVCLDGLECLGAKMRAELEAWAATSPCQFFVTRVVDDAPLTVKKSGGC